MSALGTLERVRNLIDGLERAMPHHELAVLNGAADVAEVGRLIATMETAQQSLTSLVMPKQRAAHRNERESRADLIDAIAQTAIERGAWLAWLDALQSRVLLRVDAAARVFWAGQLPERIHGLLLDKDVQAALLHRHVLAWSHPHEPGKSWRIVHTHWLECHADIRAHVIGERIPGRACQFCRIVELPTSAPLVLIPGTRRGPMDPPSTLNLRSVYVHEQCRPYWQRWVEIAQRYDSQEAAQAADVEAGRVSKVPPAPEALLLERKAPEGFFRTDEDSTP